MAKQLSGLVADNEKKLAPTLREAELGDRDAGEEPRQHRQGAARPARSISSPQGETVANGPYYNAFVANLIPGAELLQPFLDYAFGFRRGVNAGQPPDNAGPRAEFPFPYNGIPGGSR